jgi:hypothetical protein
MAPDLLGDGGGRPYCELASVMGVSVPAAAIVPLESEAIGSSLETFARPERTVLALLLAASSGAAFLALFFASG